MNKHNLTLQDVSAILLSRMDSMEERLANVSKSYITPQIVSQGKLAEILDVTVATIIKYDHLGYIPSIRIGSAVKYDVKKVLESLERRKRK